MRVDHVRADVVQHRLDQLGQLDEWHRVEALVGQCLQPQRGKADRLGSAPGVLFQLFHHLVGIAAACPVGDDDRMPLSPGLDMPGKGPSRAKELVVGMRSDNGDSCYLHRYLIPAGSAAGAAAGAAPSPSAHRAVAGSTSSNRSPGRMPLWLAQAWAGWGADPGSDMAVTRRLPSAVATRAASS